MANKVGGRVPPRRPKGSPKTPGSGRKKHVPPLKSRCVSLTDEQVRLLRIWGKGDMSAGLRWLIDAAALLVVRAEKCQGKGEGGGK